MIFRNFILVCLACSVAGYSQSPSAAPSSAAPTPAVPHEAKPVVFHSDLLDLSFTYPGSMAAKTLPTLEAQHAATAKAQPADESDENRRADQCTDAAFAATRADDPRKSTVSVAIYGDQRGTVLSADHAVQASIVISRVGLECTPTTYQDRADEMATAVAEMAIEESKQENDLHTIDKPIWYEMGKTRIHFAVAEGSQPGNQPAAEKEHPGRRWLASLALVWEKNLISIVIESNDLPFLNEMLHGSLSLGNQAPAALFPADLAPGKPIQPKP